MNLSALPDDQSRVGYSWTPLYIGERARAEQMFDAHNEPRKLLNRFDRDALVELCDVLEEIGGDAADLVLGWLDIEASLASDIQMVREIHTGAYGDSAQAVVQQAIDTMAERRAETLVRGQFPNWRAR